MRRPRAWRPGLDTTRFGSHSTVRPGRRHPVRRGYVFVVRATVPGTRPDVTERESHEKNPAPTRVLPDGTESALRETKPASPPTERRGASQAATAPIRGRRASTRDFVPDPETGVAPGFTRCRNMRSRCRCSMCPAIHINSRSWLRSSSTHEPSDPPLRVVSRCSAATISFPMPRGKEEAGERRESLSPVQVSKP